MVWECESAYPILLNCFIFRLLYFSDDGIVASLMRFPENLMRSEGLGCNLRVLCKTDLIVWALGNIIWETAGMPGLISQLICDISSCMSHIICLCCC